MALYNYRIKAYVYLVKVGRLEIESIPEEYRIPVAERLVSEAE